jgi:hypothetical protein
MREASPRDRHWLEDDMAGTTSAPAQHRQANERFIQAFHRLGLGVFA